MSIFSERRAGRFSIDKAVLQDCSETAMAILADVFVVRAEHLYDTDRFDYVGYHQDFDPVEEGREASHYTARLRRVETLVNGVAASRTVFDGWERA